MPADHLACRLDVWEGMPDDLKRIMEVAMEKLAFRTAMTFEVLNNEAAVALAEKGVTLHEWSQDDRNAFRKASQEQWQNWAAKTPEAKTLVDSHLAFMKNLGLVAE
jgi:TRAP-type mannitol/chloroaromatic compound transport system substrate-binding protein